MAEDFRRQDDREDAREKEARVRVMSAQERAGYEGVTIEETPDGRSYEEGASGEEHARRAHVVFETVGTGDVIDRVMRQLVGPRWRWKLGLAAAVLILGLVFFFIALPALSVFCVAAAVIWLIGRLLHG